MKVKTQVKAGQLVVNVGIISGTSTDNRGGSAGIQVAGVNIFNP